jgi:acetylornithine/LysW-gamma-L-lysine aminotransferase
MRALLLEKLIEITPEGLNHAFLCNSGTESMEAAIKFARLSTGKTDFISTVRGFHGRTLGALSATHKSKYREGFEPLVPGFSFVPYNNFEILRETVTEKTAGIIVEVVQGEGGVYIADAAYLRNMRNLCTEKGILLIIDEVQTGFCRTGRMFACDHFNLKPDILCVAKAMGGGFPIGAAVCADTVKVSVGKHGTTFGGNPLACAAASAAIQFMVNSNLAEQAAEKGKYLLNKLRQKKYKCVNEIRGIGLMIGIELKEEPKNYILQLMDKGVLVLPAGRTVIRLLPPLTIEYELLDRVVEVLAETL